MYIIIYIYIQEEYNLSEIVEKKIVLRKKEKTVLNDLTRIVFFYQAMSITTTI